MLVDNYSEVKLFIRKDPDILNLYLVQLVFNSGHRRQLLLTFNFNTVGLKV
jgi:hypothetical protein